MPCASAAEIRKLLIRDRVGILAALMLVFQPLAHRQREEPEE